MYFNTYSKCKCMKRETSGTDIHCNAHHCDDCYLQYTQGTIGEQREALALALNIIRKYKMILQTYEVWNEVNDCSYNKAMLRIGMILANDDVCTPEKYKSLLNAVFGVESSNHVRKEGDNDNQG